jgi:hypothetical protein
VDRGWHIRHNDGVQEWFHDADYDVLGYVTGTLGLDPLLDVQIDASGIAVLDINDTGIQHFYYGPDLAQWVIDQGFVNPEIEWQFDQQAGAGEIERNGAALDREAAGLLIDLAYDNITLHEDSDPTAIYTEAAWRAFRVELRAYIKLVDAVIVVTNQPAEPS